MGDQLRAGMYLVNIKMKNTVYITEVMKHTQLTIQRN